MAISAPRAGPAVPATRTSVMTPSVALSAAATATPGEGGSASITAVGVVLSGGMPAGWVGLWGHVERRKASTARRPTILATNISGPHTGGACSHMSRVSPSRALRCKRHPRTGDELPGPLRRRVCHRGGRQSPRHRRHPRCPRNTYEDQVRVDRQSPGRGGLECVVQPMDGRRREPAWPNAEPPGWWATARGGCG